MNDMNISVRESPAGCSVAAWCAACCKCRWISPEKTLLRFFFPIHFFAAQEVMSETDILTYFPVIFL